MTKLRVVFALLILLTVVACEPATPENGTVAVSQPQASSSSSTATSSENTSGATATDSGVLTPIIIEDEIMGMAPPVAAPAPQNFTIQVTPSSPQVREELSQLYDAVDQCNGETANWGQKTLTACNGHDLNQNLPLGTSFIGVTSVAYYITAADITVSGSLVAAMVTSGTELIGFIVVAAEAAVPTLIVAGVIALPVISIAALAMNPPVNDPLINQWIKNRYPPLDLAITTDLALTNTIDEVGVLDVPTSIFETKWSEEEKNFRLKGYGATIIEDNVMLASMTAAAMRAAGFKIDGIFPSCESWQLFMTRSKVFIVDYHLARSMSGDLCVPIIATISPGSIIISHSFADPDKNIDGETLREKFFNAGQGLDTSISVIVKDLRMRDLIQELMRLHRLLKL